MSDERPIDIWNEMTRGARESGRCMFCDDELFHAPSTRRPVICTADDCRKAYHRMYRHLVRNPRERNEPAEVAREKTEERNARQRAAHAAMDPARRARFLARCKRNRSRAGAPAEAAPD